MKLLSVISMASTIALFGAANAADITVYYSPTCPHCHHAREFISETLVYEYPTIAVNMVNVMDEANVPQFRDVIAKCGYNSGGVPVIVVGEKCFQGYANFMQNDIRTAVEADMSDADKAAASENKKAMAENADEFKAAHSERANVITDGVAQKKTDGGKSYWFYGVLIALVAGLGYVLTRHGGKK